MHTSYGIRLLVLLLFLLKWPQNEAHPQTTKKHAEMVMLLKNSLGSKQKTFHRPYAMPLLESYSWMITEKARHGVKVIYRTQKEEIATEDVIHTFSTSQVIRQKRCCCQGFIAISKQLSPWRSFLSSHQGNPVDLLWQGTKRKWMQSPWYRANLEAYGFQACSHASQRSLESKMRPTTLFE